MNQEFINSLASKLKALGAMHAIGDEWVSYTGVIPSGGVPYLGQEVTRATYSDLWTYVQDKELVKTEEEWQTLFTTQNGNVPYYSSGDGSTTFRMPRLVGYTKGAENLSNVGTYTKEGLPNITGYLNSFKYGTTEGTPNGAFFISSTYTGNAVTNSGTNTANAVNFDASRSNPIYGNSDHVTPETVTVLFGVYAFGQIINTGELDAATLANGLVTVETKFNNYQEMNNTSSYHNGIYRGKNLTNLYTMDALSQKIQNNDFSDLFIGDYIEVSMASTYATETVRWLFAGFDMFMNNGDTAITSHHIVLVPEDCFQNTQQMNSSNTTENGYKGSAMHTTVLPNYVSAMEVPFGSHLATFRTLLTNSISTSLSSMAGAGWGGASNGWEWVSTKCRLLSEVEVYGSTVFSSSFFDVGEANNQLPLFRLCPDRMACGGGFNSTGRWSWWLKAVASSTLFAGVSDYGVSGAYGASITLGVRPLILFI